MRGPIAAREERVGLLRGVVIDGDVAGAVEELKQSSVGPLATDVDEQIVPDRDPARWLAGVDVVVTEHVDPGGHVLDEVIDECDVLDNGPRRAAVLIPWREENRESI